MKEEFPGWFGSQIYQHHIDKDPSVSASSKLFALACGPTPTPISVNSCLVNGARFVVHSRDERHTTQNNDICSPGKDGEMYYDQLEEILVFSLNDMEITAWHIDGQSINLDAPPNIIDVDADDDIIDDEDVLPHDLADSDDEDVVNVDDDDGMSADVTRGHGGDGGGDDRPPPHQIAGGFRGSGKGTQKPNLGGRKPRTSAPHAIRALARNQEWRQSTSWQDLHDNKSSLKKNYWVKNPNDETYDVEAIRSRRPANIFAKDWDAQIRFWFDPKNMARCAQNAQNREKSTVICRQGSRSLAALRNKHMQSSATHDYPFLIQTFFDIHTVGSVFLWNEDRRLYEEMQRLHVLDKYTDDQIMVVLKKQMDMTMKVVRSDDKMSQLLTQLQSQNDVGSGSGSNAGGDDESGDDEDADEDEEDEDC
uniref:Uncharacterized protein n=1 Tax=Tanacetum cinerariifolium TaxID=118510 RepID=A0A699GJQ3_TANCI|nr:hypothetical protein [Tanacetum cinerariifolium]